MKYFWCSSGEDGTRILEVSKERLDDLLADAVQYRTVPTFLSKVPKDDKGCWVGVPENAVLILAGEIMVPRATQVVTKLEV